MVANNNYKPNTYTQLYIHVAFAVKYRASLLQIEVQKDLYALIASTLTSNGHKPLAIGGMPDHIHVLFGLNPNQDISNIVKEMKRITSRWLNESNFYRSQIDGVIKYILNQPRHHLNKSFWKNTQQFSQISVSPSTKITYSIRQSNG